MKNPSYLCVSMVNKLFIFDCSADSCSAFLIEAVDVAALIQFPDKTRIKEIFRFGGLALGSDARMVFMPSTDGYCFLGNTASLCIFPQLRHLTWNRWGQAYQQSCGQDIRV